MASRRGSDLETLAQQVQVWEEQCPEWPGTVFVQKTLHRRL